MSKHSNSIKLRLALTMLALPIVVSMHAQTEAGRKGFCVHGQGIVLPIGKFLLIRKGDELGALRITRITPDTTTKPKVGEWLGTVDYESYFVEGSSLKGATAKRFKDQLKFGVMKGWSFHTSWQSGHMKAQVGLWKFVFFDEDGMFMTDYSRWNGIEHDSGLEFAPTGATDVAQIDPSNPRLHWYRRDPNTDIPCPIAAPL